VGPAFSLDGQISAPARGAALPISAIDEAQYSGTVAWQTQDGTAHNGAFAASTVYRAVVTLTVKNGYTFDGVAENSFAYSGAASVTNLANSGIVTITFPATAAPGEDTVVNVFSLDGKVSAPAWDAQPVTTGIDTTQYMGTVAWQTQDGTAHSGAFAASTVYKAIVTLTAKSGFTFTGVAANSFRYTGATEITNAADSGTVTISFPATAAFIAVTNISGVPSAAAAGTPLALSGTVVPASATNKTIAWSVKNAGSTGAVISGGALTATGAGTVTVTATIANGLTASTPYTQDFTITVSSLSSPSEILNITVGFNLGDITITGSIGANVIHQSGSESLAFSATGYDNVIWYVDGSPTGISGNTLTIDAVSYDVQIHSVTFTGYKNGTPYSQVIPFTVSD
jgi:hypothetical protein